MVVAAELISGAQQAALVELAGVGLVVLVVLVLLVQQTQVAVAAQVGSLAPLLLVPQAAPAS